MTEDLAGGGRRHLNVAMGNQQAVPADEVLEQIARRHLGVETLQTRRADRLDFHDLGVESLRAALVAAYRAGFEAACAKATK